MAKDANGVVRKVVVGASTALVAGACVGLMALWQRAVSAEDVARQIRIESPYRKDEGIIKKALTEEIPEIKADVRAMREEQIEQRGILERMERKIP